MRNPTKAEVKAKTTDCIKALQKEIAKRPTTKVTCLLSFAQGYMGTDNTFRQVKGVDYLPFEIIDYCLENGVR